MVAGGDAEMKIKDKIIPIMICILLWLIVGKQMAQTLLAAPKEGSSSEAKSQKVNDLKKGLEMTVCIKGVHHEGNFKILVKENFIKRDIERAILIYELKPVRINYFPEFRPRDVIDYILYMKRKGHATDVWQYIYENYRINKFDENQMRKEKYSPFDFTLYELMIGVDKLISHDQHKLGEDNLSVKKRIYHKIPEKTFSITKEWAGPTY